MGCRLPIHVRTCGPTGALYCGNVLWLPHADDEDYSATDVLVHFEVGQTPMARKVAITILEDSILELAERFVVSLELTNQTTSGVKIGTPPTTTVEITDNDGE